MQNSGQCIMAVFKTAVCKTAVIPIGQISGHCKSVRSGHSCSAEVFLTEVFLSVCLLFVFVNSSDSKDPATMEKCDNGEKTVAEYLDTLAHILSEPTRLLFT